jgi:citrate lyase subunit beta/citryl-CoA lyase
VPAHVDRFVAAATRSGADAVVLDLEDGVPAEQRTQARAALLDDVTVIEAAGVEVSVRVNADDDLGPDLAACLQAGARRVLIPKVEGPEDVGRVHDELRALDYAPELDILVETCRGVGALQQILASDPPLHSVALGVEDLRSEIEPFAPDSESSPTLQWAHAALIIAATAAGITPLGLIGSIAEFTRLDDLEQSALAAFRMGYRGTYCIHPRQIPVLNAAFLPRDSDHAWAERVLHAAADGAAAGRGAVVVDGRMVDAPLITRARRILELRATHP